MKTGWTIVAALVVAGLVSNLCADEVSDHLERALELSKAKKYLEAKAEIEKALALVTPLAKAQIPAPEVNDRTYVNYEHAFRVTRPEKDWEFNLLKTKTPGSGATYPLCQIAYTREGAAGEMALFYVRDLQAFLGSRYADIAGREMDFLRTAGKQMASSIKQLQDVQVTGQTDVTVSTLTGVRTDYRARKGATSMKCFTVHVLREHMMFTAMFIGSVKNEKEVDPAFREILDSIDLSAVAMPK